MTQIKELEGVSIHPNAIVETEDIGEGTRIWAFAHILEGARIGRNCNVCDHTFIEGNVVVGDDVTVKSGAYLWDGVRIENNVFIGPNATFINHIRPRSKMCPWRLVRTIIKKGASIGANATILCGITVGKWALIGAGTVVTKDVPDHALVYGSSARIKGYVCECTENLIFEDSKANCACGKVYELKGGAVARIE